MTSWRSSPRYMTVFATAVLCYVAVLSFGAAAATEQGTGIAALVIPVFGVGVIASRTILAGVPDRFGPPRTLIAAVTIEAAGLAGMAATTSTPVALLARTTRQTRRSRRGVDSPLEQDRARG